MTNTLENYVKKQGTSQGFDFLDETGKYSDSTLIDLAKGWKSQSFFNKFYESLLPSMREGQRQAAKYVLKERGTEYEEPVKTKINYRQEFKELGDRIRDVFYGLANLIVNKK